ncbi:hypothetical protein GTS_55200 [Gandjariella thermophila]|uniref:DUF397 domain-containing protein n=1 Tax=Gandjariella thermophila TaxID=1931992 RepID=A0A4D4JJ09_9PSEU|nr:hypothetical protein GTS_55200 [Gandjariella thermophila]
MEVAPTTSGVVIRHSKHPESGTITFSLPAWSAFVAEACDGLTSTNGVATITPMGADTLVRSVQTGVELRFDQAEWSAFVAGALDGEFNFAGHLAATPS